MEHMNDQEPNLRGTRPWSGQKNVSCLRTYRKKAWIRFLLYIFILDDTCNLEQEIFALLSRQRRRRREKGHRDANCRHPQTISRIPITRRVRRHKSLAPINEAEIYEFSVSWSRLC